MCARRSICALWSLGLARHGTLLSARNLRHRDPVVVECAFRCSFITYVACISVGLHYILWHILVGNRPKQLLRRLRVGYLSLVFQSGAYFSFPFPHYYGYRTSYRAATKETHGETKERKE